MSWLFLIVLQWTSGWNMTVLVTQSCLTPCNLMDCRLPGFSVHGILQARILEWVGIPSPENLPNPGIKPTSPARQADSLVSEPPGKLVLKVDYLLNIALCMCQSQIFTTKLSILPNAWISAYTSLPNWPLSYLFPREFNDGLRKCLWKDHVVGKSWNWQRLSL